MKPDILGLSALLTTTLPEMKKIINALTESGLRDKVEVMVGGAPVNETYARRSEPTATLLMPGKALRSPNSFSNDNNPFNNINISLFELFCLM